MEPHRKLRRKAASKYLFDEHGIVRAPSTLAKYAVIGGGPVFQRMGRDPVYTPANLDAWVASQLSRPMRSTSDLAQLACEAHGTDQFDPTGASDNSASRGRSSSLGSSAAGLATQPAAAQARGGGS
jgi:hypothetical protein